MKWVVTLGQYVANANSLADVAWLLQTFDEEKLPVGLTITITRTEDEDG